MSQREPHRARATGAPPFSAPSLAPSRWTGQIPGAQRVPLYCDETNVRSWRLAERCGFVREGHLRQTQRRARLADGTWGGDYVYGLLRDDYLGGRA